MLFTKILRSIFFIIAIALILIIPRHSRAAGVVPNCLIKFIKVDPYRQCTFYVADIRRDLCEITDKYYTGPDEWYAGRWADNFINLYNTGKSRYLVDKTPEVGAVVVFDWGHVGIVEEILKETDDIRISEANYDRKGSFRDTQKYKITDVSIVGFIHTLLWSTEEETGLPYSISEETKIESFSVIFPLRKISIGYESDFLLFIDNKPVVSFNRPSDWTTSDWITRWLWPGQHTVTIRYLRGTFTDGHQDREPVFSQTWLGNSSAEAAEILPISYVFYAQPSSAKVGETVQIKVGANIDGTVNNISGIRISVDGKFIQGISGYEGSVLWNTSGFSLGKHTITFRAEIENYSGNITEGNATYELITVQSTTITPPVLVSPQAGQILNNSSVRFTWQSPNIPAQNGYTFRLSKYPDPDIIDPNMGEVGGIGNEHTSYDYTFPADGVYFWHMRTWNTFNQPGPWVSRQITINSNPFSYVTLCPSEDKSDPGCVMFTGGGKYDMTNPSLAIYNVNDTFRSVFVPPGMSVMLFRESGLIGTAECYSGNRPDLPTGAPWDLGGQVSSIQIFYQSDCRLDGLQSVVMYDLTNYGNYAWGVGSTPGMYNLTKIGPYGDPYFNSTAESIRIPSGLSAKLYDNFDGSGESSGCLTGNVADLGSMKNKATAIELFPSSDCSNGSSDTQCIHTLSIEEIKTLQVVSPKPDEIIQTNSPIVFEWTPLPSAVEYRIHYQGNKSGSSEWIKESKWIIDSLPSGDYDWLVEARDCKGNSFPHAPDHFKILGSSPKAATDLKVIPISQSQIDLTWQDNSDNENGFRIYRYLEGETAKKLTETSPNQTQFQDTGLPCGTDYWYYVTAFNGNGESGGSNSWRRFTYACTPQLKSPSLGALIGDQTPTLAWDQAGAYERFQIQIDESSDFASPVINLEISGSTSFTISQTFDYGKWYWRVRALGKNVNADFTKMQDWSEWSQTRDFEIGEDEMPPSLEIISHGDGDILDTDNITIQVEASDNQSEITGVYFWVRYDGPEFHGLGWDFNDDDGWSKTWNASGVADQPIRLQVYAKDQAGNEGWDWVDVVLDRSGTIDETPPNVKITSPTEGSVIDSDNITIQVEASDDQSGIYHVEYFVWYDEGDGSGSRYHSIGTEVNGADGWSMSWDASGVPDQQVTLLVYAMDVVGNGASHWVDVVLDRAGSIDETPPNVQITSPADGSVIDSDNITIKVEASDDQSGIDQIQFFVGYDDGSGFSFHVIGWDANGEDGWSKSWDAIGIPDQQVRLQVYAWDGAGNGTWHWVDVILQRGEPPQETEVPPTEEPPTETEVPPTEEPPAETEVPPTEEPPAETEVPPTEEPFTETEVPPT